MLETKVTNPPRISTFYLFHYLLGIAMMDIGLALLLGPAVYLSALVLV